MIILGDQEISIWRDYGSRVVFVTFPGEKNDYRIAICDTKTLKCTTLSGHVLIGREAVTYIGKLIKAKHKGVFSAENEISAILNEGDLTIVNQMDIEMTITNGFISFKT